MFQQLNNLFTPLRSTVGPALTFEISLKYGSKQTHQSGLAKNLKLYKRDNNETAANDDKLLKYWPTISTLNFTGSQKKYSPDPNQPLLIAPDPFHQPFNPDSPYFSIFALADNTSNDLDLSRKLTMVFDIKLKTPNLVGGVAYMGYPSLWHTTNKFGLTSANYGLPREMRISIGSHTGENTHENRFIDSDVHHTKQVQNYSSGFHYFHVEPTLTNHFTLQISDFPQLLRSISITDGKYEFKQAYGLTIPYFYVFAYQEKIHYHHNVPGGVVGSFAHKRQNKEQELSTEWLRLIDADKSIYQVYPASSIFRDHRAYLHIPFDPGFAAPSANYSALEQFVSQPIEKGERISLICQQCDHTLRSIAGIELLIPVADPTQTGNLSEDELEKNLGLPAAEVNLIDKVGIRIFELDFPAGVSPLNAHKNQLKKYKYLLLDRTISKDDALEFTDATNLSDDQTNSPNQRSLRFKRSSNQQYFEIELTNLGGTTGQVVVLSASFIQSAHITLHPKLASHLNVPRMHFRIVGDDLVGDYAQIGANGFNFSIERLSGGQPIRQLISVRSLADLMQSGIAKVISNSRRRAVEFEKSNVYDQSFSHPQSKGLPSRGLFPDENRPNYQVTQALDRGEFWHKSRSGKKTFPNEHQISDDDFQNSNLLSGFLSHHDVDMVKAYKEYLMRDADQHGSQFESYATTESGTHTEHMFPDNSDWASVQSYFDSVEQFASFLPGGKIVPASPATLLSRISNHKYWDGLRTNNLIVNGLSNYFLHPGNLTGSLGMSAPTAMNYDAILTLANMAVQNQISLAEFVERVLMLIFLDSSSPSSSNPGLGLNTIMFFGGSGGSLSGNLGAGVGVVGALSGSAGIGASLGIQSPFPGVQYTNSMGSQGTVTQQSNRTAFSYSKTLNDQARANMNFSSVVAGENKRIIERRAVPFTDQKRLKGAEVMWQGELKDIILGTIPLDISFPALSDKYTISNDEVIRVRFGNGIGDDIEADFWFEVNETEVKDDF